MIKRSFFGLKKVQIPYHLLDENLSCIEVAPSDTVTYFTQDDFQKEKSFTLKKGDILKKGEKFTLLDDSPYYAISSIHGTIKQIGSYTGNYGEEFTTITLSVNETDEADDTFKTKSSAPALDTIKEYLAHLPGNLPLDIFDENVRTIVIYGIDPDPLVLTNQYVIQNFAGDIKNGIQTLKKILKDKEILLVCPKSLTRVAFTTGADVRPIDDIYPAALPEKILQKLGMNNTITDEDSESAKAVLVSAEAIASLGKAFETENLALDKIVTFINKNGETRIVKTKIGTPIIDLCRGCGVELENMDRIILNGMMKGETIFSEDFPIRPSTDAILVQDHTSLDLVSNYPCINCGECIRVCPEEIEINMLVRYLEAGQYETASDDYRLHDCIECGLCNYVCVAKMPILQYIKLGKYELERTKIAETINE